MERGDHLTRPHRRRAAAEAGFTYVLMLICVALTGYVASELLRIQSALGERSRLAEQAWVGEQYRRAILRYSAAVQGGGAGPRRIDDLLEDRRNGTVVRHLRQIYADPACEPCDWQLVEDGAGHVIGVRSTSNGRQWMASVAGKPAMGGGADPGPAGGTLLRDR